MNAKMIASRIAQKTFILSLLLSAVNDLVALRPVKVITTNLLAEKFYQEYYVRGSDKERMPWKTRSSLLRKFLQNQINAAHKDGSNLVVAMQECDWDMMKVLKSLTSPGRATNNQQSSDASQPPAAPLQVAASPEKSRLGFLVMGNWERTYHADLTVDTNKTRQRFAVMQLVERNADGKQEVLNVINIHGIGGPDMSDPTKRYRQIQGLTQYMQEIRELEGKKQHWVVCGDFNLDSRTNLHAYRDLLGQLRASGIEFKDAFTTDPRHRVSYYKERVENLDYMFVSPELKSSDSRIMPYKDPNQKLLTHGHGSSIVRPDKHRQCYSDHCALSVNVEADARQ